MFFRGDMEDLNITPEKFERAKVFKISRVVVSSEDVKYKYDHLEFAKYVDGDFFTAKQIRVLTGPDKDMILDRDLTIDDGRPEYSAYYGNENVTYNLKSYHMLGQKAEDGVFTSAEVLQKIADEINENRRKYAKEDAIKKEIEENSEM